jgi:monoamine oxidase
MTLPPKLFLNTVRFDPRLPQNLIDVGQLTHTWMSESIKVALTYSNPFWKQEKPIGSIFSNTGLVSEMYDHSNYENTLYALKGFINGGYAFTTIEERKQRVLAQLSKYFGNQVEDYLSYHELIWRNEDMTHYDYEGFILPHQNNGNPMYQDSLYEGRLHIGGSETASQHPGYMDGAVESGRSLAHKMGTIKQ